jgi:Flp pilus assembly protein TadD
VSCLLFRSAEADGIDKAHTLLAQSNFELAAQFLDRALELEPTNLEARELLGVAHLEAGDPEVGRTVRDRVRVATQLIRIAPASTPTPAYNRSAFITIDISLLGAVSQ